jgi:hypothetical protein
MNGDTDLRPCRGPQPTGWPRQVIELLCASSEGMMRVILGLSGPTRVSCEWTGVS